MTYPCPSLPPCLQSILQQIRNCQDFNITLNRLQMLPGILMALSSDWFECNVSELHQFHCWHRYIQRYCVSQRYLWFRRKILELDRNLPICISCKRLRVWQLWLRTGSVLIQNGSNQNTTLSSGYYLYPSCKRTYNFSYSKDGFNTTTWRLQSACR